MSRKSGCLWYTFSFNLQLHCLVSYDKPVAEFMCDSIVVKDWFGSCGHVCFPQAEWTYCGLYNDCSTVCFVILFFYFL